MAEFTWLIFPPTSCTTHLTMIKEYLTGFFLNWRKCHVGPKSHFAQQQVGISEVSAIEAWPGSSVV